MQRLFFTIKVNFKSFIFFLKSQFINTNFDVIFTSSISFNREKNFLNPYFEPFIEICKKENLEFVVFEEPDLGRAFKNMLHGKHSVSLFLITFTEIIFRKLFFFVNASKREAYIRKIIKTLYFRNISSSNIVTLIHHKVDLWRFCFHTAPD